LKRRGRSPVLVPKRKGAPIPARHPVIQHVSRQFQPTIWNPLGYREAYELRQLEAIERLAEWMRQGLNTPASLGHEKTPRR
jgi:hypothetical protein